MPMPDPLAARRAFAPEGYATLADVGLDLDLVSPYQLSCGNPAGPVLITYNHVDAPTARADRDRIATQGYLPEMLFNRVLDRALAQLGAPRAALYVTHAFHALPASRSERIPTRLVEDSFDAITRHEIRDRPVLTLGRAAADAARRFGVPHQALPHLSARGATIDAKAATLATALAPLLTKAAA